MEEHELQVVAAVLSDASGRVLVARRPFGKTNGGLWEFPGGKVEPGESHASALVRELREELGCEVEVGEKVASARHAYFHAVIVLHSYFCSVVAGEPRALEHLELRYVPRDDLRALAFAPANLATVEALMKG